MYFVEYNVENNSNEEQVKNQGESGDLIYIQLLLITQILPRSMSWQSRIFISLRRSGCIP